MRTIFKSFIIFFLLLIVGCFSNDYYPTSFNEKQYSHYQQIINSPQKKSNRNYKEIFAEEIKNSPIPIFIMERDKYKKEFLTPFFSEEKDYINTLAGLFVDGNYIVDDWPETFIFINKSLPIETKLLVLFHELGHYRCSISNCYCLKRYSKDHICEVHANCNVILKCIDHNLSDLLTLFIVKKVKVSKLSYPKEHYLHKYIKASQEIQKTDIWNLGLQYLISTEKIQENNYEIEVGTNSLETNTALY